MYQLLAINSTLYYQIFQKLYPPFFLVYLNHEKKTRSNTTQRNHLSLICVGKQMYSLMTVYSTLYHWVHQNQYLYTAVSWCFIYIPIQGNSLLWKEGKIQQNIQSCDIFVFIKYVRHIFFKDVGKCQVCLFKYM